MQERWEASIKTVAALETALLAKEVEAEALQTQHGLDLKVLTDISVLGWPERLILANSTHALPS